MEKLERKFYTKFLPFYKDFIYSAYIFYQDLETLIFLEKVGHFSTFFCTHNILLDTEGFIVADI